MLQKIDDKESDNLPNNLKNEQPQEYANSIIEAEEKNRVPSLFLKDKPGVIYYENRNGIITTIIHTPNDPSECLSEIEQKAIREFLFAQYINHDIGVTSSYYDPAIALENNLHAEPTSFFGKGDIHTIVGSEDGQILGYLGVKGSFPEGDRLDSESVISKSHVLRVFSDSEKGNPYQEIPEYNDIDASRIREMRKFVVRQRLLTGGLGIKSALVSTELVLGLVSIADQFKQTVEIIIGDTDPSIIGKNFRAFNIPVEFMNGFEAHPENLSEPYNNLWKVRYAGRHVLPFVIRIKDVNGMAHKVTDVINSLLSKKPREAISVLLRNLNNDNNSVRKEA